MQLWIEFGLSSFRSSIELHYSRNLFNNQFWFDFVLFQIYLTRSYQMLCISRNTVSTFWLEKKKKTNTKHTRNKWTKSINKTKKKYNFFACVLRSDQVHRWRLLSKKKKQSSKKFPKKSTPSPKNKKINPVTETNSISFLNNRGSQIYPEVIYRYRKLAAFFEKHKWFHIPFRFFFISRCTGMLSNWHINAEVRLGTEKLSTRFRSLNEPDQITKQTPLGSVWIQFSPSNYGLNKRTYISKSLYHQLSIISQEH